jgi:hypothetical protein
VNLDLPLFEDLTPPELDACLEDLDQALDAAFLGDLESALERANDAGVYDGPALAVKTSAA